VTRKRSPRVQATVSPAERKERGLNARWRAWLRVHAHCALLPGELALDAQDVTSSDPVMTSQIGPAFEFSLRNANV
jgi:hypothetical protein